MLLPGDIFAGDDIAEKVMVPVLGDSNGEINVFNPLVRAKNNRFNIRILGF